MSSGFWLSHSRTRITIDRIPSLSHLDLAGTPRMVLHFTLLLLLSLCTQGMMDEAAPFSPSVPPGEEDECGEVFSLESNHRAVEASLTKLGLTLLEHLKPSPEQPNVLISPLSIALALSQLALGAQNETQAQLLKALHANDLPCYHKLLSGLQQHLNTMAIQVASRLYLRPGFKVKKEFVQESLHLYKSEPAPLTDVEEVNKWVEEVTHGHMTNFLTSIPRSVVLLLLNALYFKGEWESRFDKELTGKDRFYINSTTPVEVVMMVAPKYPLSMMLDNALGAQVARFRFQNNTSFLVVMPSGTGSENVSTVAAKLNISDLYTRLPAESTMQVKMPKFKLEYKQELQEPLTKIGLGSLFASPDLSGITEGPLQVSSVQHASAITLSEEGAEASAATAIHLLRSVPMFAVNMPFLFALTDDTTHVPLFLGVITNPNPHS
ncbi:alpha-2-antiplasmin-like [Alosa sapidissima]|uniref:alpha-2-antiplasmin-like n=1 Tax=Alosa sapidissima TaxID=34773 RepID=UPI001C09A1AA|nr:alpha-2-antiplasmin-like [Alosa sapidissima]